MAAGLSKLVVLEKAIFRPSALMEGAKLSCWSLVTVVNRVTVIAVVSYNQTSICSRGVPWLSKSALPSNANFEPLLLKLMDTAPALLVVVVKRVSVSVCVS